MIREWQLIFPLIREKLVINIRYSQNRARNIPSSPNKPWILLQTYRNFLSMTFLVFWGSGSRYISQKLLTHFTIFLQEPNQLPNHIFPVLREMKPLRGVVRHHLFFILLSSFRGRNVTSLSKVYCYRKWKMFKRVSCGLLCYPYFCVFEVCSAAST